jgi:hypothetical protein
MEPADNAPASPAELGKTSPESRVESETVCGAAIVSRCKSAFNDHLIWVRESAQQRPSEFSATGKAPVSNIRQVTLYGVLHEQGYRQ